MQTSSFQAAGRNAFVVKVDSYMDGELRGRLESIRYTGERSFKSTFRLLQMIQELLDTQNCPGAGACRELYELFEPPGGMATLKVDVLFTQNKSWQGVLTVPDRAREASFRSVLELLMLIDAELAP